MRVRPFFLFVLALSCSGILLFAATNVEQVPALMQVHVHQQHIPTAGMTTIELHLTDAQGLPIEQATIVSSARMTNMQMSANQSSVDYLGQGNYVAHLRLYMAGPWAITVQADSDGFNTLHQTLLVQI